VAVVLVLVVAPRRSHRPQDLFRKLSVDNILLLFSALMCERRVIMVSSSLSTLSSCVHGALATLYPLVWEQVLVPIVPASLLNFACAPMPFVMGVHSMHLKEVLSMPLVRGSLICGIRSVRVRAHAIRFVPSCRRTR
jgi:hypothetical protein